MTFAIRAVLAASFLSMVALAAPLRAADAPEGEVEKAIRKAAPVASAIDYKDWTKLGTQATAPKPSDLENQPLALLFLCIPVFEKMTEAQTAELDFGPTTPRPSDLANAFKPGFFAIHVTPLQPSYIKGVSAKLEGETATGEISFAAEKVYSGKVSYTAKKTDGKWAIVEFRFPARGLKTTLGEDGKWKIGEIK